MENNPQNSSQANAPGPGRKPGGKPACGESTHFRRPRPTGNPANTAPSGNPPRNRLRASAPGAKRHSTPSRGRNPAGTRNGARRTAVNPSAKRKTSGDTYAMYKLIGALAVAAVVLVIIIVALFAGGASGGVTAFADDGDSTALNTKTVAESETAAAAAETAKTGNGIDVICIDPGHGYDDPGATYEPNMGDIPEKAVTLDVALLLAQKLRDAGLTVIMTRSDDVIPEDNDGGQYLFNPFARVDFVNAHPEIDLFISLHCDAYVDDTSIGGTRIYTYTGGVDGTAEYAGALSAALSKTFSFDVPIIAKNYAEAYYVTKELSIPSVLIEMGFITNADDAVNLLSDEWRGTFTAGVTQGILDYIAALG